MMEEYLVCNRVGHEDQQISCICTLLECEFQRPCCAFCIIDDHVDHVKSIIKIKDAKLQYQSKQDYLMQMQQQRRNILTELDETMTLVNNEGKKKPTQEFFEITSLLLEELEMNQILESDQQTSLKEQFKQQEKHEEAIIKALQINNQKPDIWCSKGISLYSLKNYEEALKNFDKACQLTPNSYIYYYNQSACLNQLKKYEEALIQIEKALKLNQNHARSWNEKGISLYYLKRKKESLECFRKSVAISRDHRRLFNFANQLEQCGFKHEALKYYKESLKKDSTYQKALNGVIRLEQQGFRV